MSIALDTPLEFLNGVGPQRAKSLRAEMQVSTVGELLRTVPMRFVDKTRFQEISSVSEGQQVQLVGVLRGVREEGFGKGRRLVATLADETGEIRLSWFNGLKWVKPKLHERRSYKVFGKVGAFKGSLVIVHPELDPSAELKGELQPVYHGSERLTKAGLSNAVLRTVIMKALDGLGDCPDPVPTRLLQAANLPSLKDCLSDLHRPKNMDSLQRAVNRLKYEEMLLMQLEVLLLKKARELQVKGFRIEELGEVFTEFFDNHMPFELTGAQKRVLKEIRSDIGSGRQMNRLLQGDVGSGKTMVATLAMLFMVGSGYQCVLMAPTEILANQHYKTVSALLEKVGLKVHLLTGSTRAAKRREIHADLESGECDVIIGTHALLEDVVKFKRLGLAVIDEQHRFGVAQRAHFWKLGENPPHILVMTATPIPRTLAMSYYGDLDVSVIDELPPGRKPVRTLWRNDSARIKLFQFLEEQIAIGRQVYVVYPLIEESEAMDYKSLMDGYEAITRRFPLPQYRVSIVHGKMKPADKDHEMQLFASGQTQIMVATTVIEVGVDVPNASVMVIESAERFGLSQLHQLRGRVGRGAEQSYCILMSGGKVSSEAKIRLQAMVDTNDGFKISEVDLQLRGPGDMLGTQQSGDLPLRYTDLSADAALITRCRQDATALLDEDPRLSTEETAGLRAILSKSLKGKTLWSKVS